ncbi:MAG TPA: thioredoxin-dependent thiol peroxidase [Mycobacteriales bacterium]|jgi:peroxiredoxin Q/BCP|nr:thioredoxin-dependent thiol peroxidase [Mycobacteriales bacterium]
MTATPTEPADPTPRLVPGQPAPPFALPDADGRTVSLADFAGRRVVVYFYPAASTPGCTTQACDFEAGRPALQEAGYAVVGISPDPPAKLARFREAEHLSFPLLSDPDRTVLTAYGAYGEKKLYGKTVRGVIRSTVVVDERGLVRSASYGVRAKGHVAKLSRELGIEA